MSLLLKAAAGLLPVCFYCRERQESGILQSGCAVPKAFQVVLLTRKADEFLNRGLTNKHDTVPAFFFRTNEKWAALAEEQYFATALLKEWHRVHHITFVCFCSADWCSRSNVRERGVVCHRTKAKQVQHHYWAAKPTLHECAPRCLSGFEIALHGFYPIRRRVHTSLRLVGSNPVRSRFRITRASGVHQPSFLQHRFYTGLPAQPSPIHRSRILRVASRKHHVPKPISIGSRQ